MKNNLFALASALMLVLMVAACGNKNEGGKTATTPKPAAKKCPAGQVKTKQYGCLPVGGCPSGMAMYQNMCISTTSTNQNNICSANQVYTYQGCLPQGNCPSGYGSLNGNCIMGLTINSYNNGYYGYGWNGYGNGYYGQVYMPPMYLYQNNNYYYYQGYRHGYPYYHNPSAGLGLYFYLGLRF